MAKKTLKYLIRGEHDGTGLRKMRQDADRTVNQVKGRFAGLASTLKAGLVGGLAGGLVAGLANPFDAAGEAIEKLDGIAKRARTSGLAAGFYQTLSVAANEASISQGLVDSSLTAFVKRMGELQGGTGPLVQTLQKLDSELAATLQTARSQEEALRIVADRMATYDTAAQRAGVASALFSRAGVDMVRILGQGGQVFDDTAEKAEAMGLIIKDGLLNRAEQLQNEFGLATQVLDLQFKAALVEVAPLLTATATGLAAMTRETRQQISPIQELIGKYGGLADAIKSAGRTLLDSPFLNPLGFLLDGASQGAEALLGQRSNAAAKSNIGVFSPRSPSTRRTSSLVPPIPRNRPERTQVSGLASDIKSLNSDLEITIERTDTWADTLQSGLSGIGSGVVDVIRGTRSLNDLLNSTIDRFASLATDNLFNALLGGLFGSIGGGPTNIVPSGFAGFFAKGGNIGAGQFGIAGEGGFPELISGPATVTPMDQIASRSGDVIINAPIDARGAQQGVGDEILRKAQPMFEQIALKVVAKERRLNPAF